MSELVKITSDGLVAEVLPSTVETWLSCGWTLVDDGGDEAESESADEADQSGGPADPDDFNEE